MHRTGTLSPLILLAACAGEIAGAPPHSSPVDPGEPAPSADPQRPAGTPGAPPVAVEPARPSPAACAFSPAAGPMRRLTRVEYDNTIRDLLGIAARTADAFQTDDTYAGFETNGATPPTLVTAERYLEAAEKLAAQADLAKLLPCAPAALDDACARTFVERFGRRAFRRPLAAAEIDRLLAAYREKRARSDGPAAARLVIAAMLQMPSFLYRPELAPADGPAAAFELASRLSYFLWATMPDDKLLLAADTGALASRDRLEAEVRRMLADPRALDAAASFHRQWLDLPRLATISKDETLYPDFKDALKVSMREENRRFVEHLWREGEGSFRTLLTGSHGFVDAALAKVYGVPAPATPYARVELPAGQRSGVLTQAGFLAVQSLPDQPSPIHRGLFVRERLLCHHVPEPPADVDITPPKVDPNQTSKQRYAQHRKDPACAGCHALMDPIGFGFDRYDAIGRWKAMDGRFPVDATGELTGTRDADGRFDGALELGTRLAGSADAQACIARQWLRFALGRVETDAEACAVDRLAQRLGSARLDLRELLVAIATSDLFRGNRTTR